MMKSENELSSCGTRGRSVCVQMQIRWLLWRWKCGCLQLFVVLSRTVWGTTALHYTINYAMLCFALLLYIILCHTILYYAILYYTIPYYTILNTQHSKRLHLNRIECNTLDSVKLPDWLWSDLRWKVRSAAA